MKVAKKGARKVFQNKKKVKVENPRKQLRKQKRQQKKLNRFNYHNTKKKDKLEGAKGGKQKKKKNGSGSESEGSEIEDDESIPSDLEGSEDDGQSSQNKGPLGKIEQDIIKSKQEESEYWSEIKKNRVEQLKSANEEEDKVIHKYEKLLKLNKRKSKTGKSKIFNDDGLDYVLDLCTDENIKKMYSAAKEVAAGSSGEDEFTEDFKIVAGENQKPKKKEEAPPKKKKKIEKEPKKLPKTDTKELKRIEKLKEAEKKYFGDDEDYFKDMEIEVDSCEGNDSEFEDGEFDEDWDYDRYSSDEGPVEAPIGKKEVKKLEVEKKVKFADEVEEDSDFKGFSSDEGPIEVPISKKAQKKLKDRNARNYESESDEDVIEEKPKVKKSAKKSSEVAEKSKNTKKKDKVEIKNEKLKEKETKKKQKSSDADLAALFQGKSSKKVDDSDSEFEREFQRIFNGKGTEDRKQNAGEKDEKLKKGEKQKKTKGKAKKIVEETEKMEVKSKTEEKKKKPEGKIKEKDEKSKKLKKKSKADDDLAALFQNKSSKKVNDSDSEFEREFQKIFNGKEIIEDSSADSSSEESEIQEQEEILDSPNQSEAENSNDGQWEDIYGRKRDKSGNLVKETQKYVPPHMRKKILDTQDLSEIDPKKREKLLNLKKQLKGFINRLAETNLHRISIDIENLYSHNARHDVNSLLTEVILSALISNVLASDRMVLEHTLLIGALHGNIGSEIGAYFLQIVVEKFDELFKKIDGFEVENKEIDNVILIISHLYTYKIFQHNLIYEILEKLSENLTEKRVECMLLVLRSIGFVLRKDDPLKLKEFIVKLQKSANNLNEELKSSSRIMYMIDILLAIKNNNITKIPQYDPSLVEHFRKLLKQFVRDGKYVTTLNINMEDILKADERGKWWLVGSAWAGVEKDGQKTKKSAEDLIADEKRAKILELAKKQRMNTDDKKEIFYILMTAEDYLDAFEKIISSVKDERSIIAVILHCALSEKNYNPYYSVLAQKFCLHNRKFQLAIQFAVWDRIKTIDDYNIKQVGNLARFLIYLIENGNLPISVLKVIEFSQIEKTMLRFLRQIMLGLLLTEESKFKLVFERIAPSMKLKPFKDSLRLFLKCFLIKDQKNINIEEDKLELLKSRMQLVETLLTSTHY